MYKWAQKISAVIFIILGMLILSMCSSQVNLANSFKKIATLQANQQQLHHYNLASITNDSYYAGDFLYISEYTKIIYWIKNEDGSVQRKVIPFSDSIKFYEEDREDGIVDIPLRLYPLYQQSTGYDTYEDFSTAIFRVPKGTIRYEYNLFD